MYDVKTAIANARKHTERDPGLAVYMVRDFPEVEAADLHDLAWAFASGNVVSNEAVWFLDMLEHFVDTGSVALEAVREK